MKISIAMATYNGAKYIREQLESFAKQTRLPDELVISDDGSSDETLNIVKNFATIVPFEVKIYRNERNIGYAQNFNNALQKTTGDLVFLSDQDDVWFTHKVEVIMRTAKENPEMLVFIHDCRYTDHSLKPLPMTSLQNRSAMKRSAMKFFIREPFFVSGSMTAIKKDFLHFVLPIPEGIGHDGWIHLFSYFVKPRMIVPEILSYWRRHESSTSRITLENTLPHRKFFSTLKVALKTNPASQLYLRKEILSEILIRINNVKNSEIGGMISNSSITKVSEEIKNIDLRINILERPRRSRVFLLVRLLYRGQHVNNAGWFVALRDILAINIDKR